MVQKLKSSQNEVKVALTRLKYTPEYMDEYDESIDGKIAGVIGNIMTSKIFIVFLRKKSIIIFRKIEVLSNFRKI
ncbi:hypothetical protein Tmath_0681 [Thermoanaerobacter mathranii subsp. mathranii str. A3]|uniref:Uncharacterized protein n=2 Tax=Thermoanaerobacter TaxID=1754 RepID=A0ABM5LP16_THEM3|nr:MULTISPECIES: hypothetical protein [Thermoanaerobacter]ADH60431.1 hypothetical protein Tmath_0681 [Thermoanaerobacter mathranii subsp. mathranii str. A3]MDK2814916.1 hypothetical protein [Thermoanaerobacter sp.]